MNGAPWGGSEEFWYHLAIWMSQRGYKVECCFFNWPQGKEDKKYFLKKSGCIIHLLPNPKSARHYLDKIIIKARVKKELTALVKKEFGLVCISQGGLLDVTYPLFNHLLAHLKKFVLIYHNYNESNLLSSKRKRSFYKWSHAARQNIVAAEKMFSAVQKIAGFKLPLGHVLINPITIPLQATPYAWPLFHEGKDYIWVVIAQLDVQRKAQDVLIKTLSADKWKQRNWQLHLYGDGPDRELLGNLVINLKLEHKVILEGHTQNVEQVLQKTHLLLQITNVDAMPLSVTEAMNMARPCIVSNVGDMPLWINDNVQGFVVPAVTEMEIDLVLQKAWDQREKWQSMGTSAFQLFNEKYPSPYEEYYVNLFTSLMKD